MQEKSRVGDGKKSYCSTLKRKQSESDFKSNNADAACI